MFTNAAAIIFVHFILNFVEFYHNWIMQNQMSTVSPMNSTCGEGHKSFWFHQLPILQEVLRIKLVRFLPEFGIVMHCPQQCHNCSSSRKREATQLGFFCCGMWTSKWKETGKTLQYYSFI